MRKLRRMIALVTVAMFLLSLMAPVASADDKVDAFNRLKGLGVAYGDTNGDPMYDKNYTRAEAAAVMVQLSGMGAAINAAKGATKFADVPASHWASGVINLAVGAGIIKGYPDGTYKPEKAVTYAEMCAMLVQALGYGPKLQGTWPANVIGKAAQLGLLDGVAVTDYNAAAVRGNVFIAADNALEVKVLKEMKDGYEEGKTLMEEKLSVKKLAEAVVTGVPNTTFNKNEVTLGKPAGSDTAIGSKKTTESFDPNPYLGLSVEAWVKDDKVFFLNVKTAASDIKTDKVKNTLTSLAEGAKIKLDELDKEYTIGKDVVAYKNFELTTDPSDIAAGDEVKIVLDGGKVKYIIANDFTTKMVEKVNTSDEKITFEVSGSLELKDKVVTIVKNGLKVGLADVKPGDVVDYVSVTSGSDGAVYAIVSNSAVEGTLKSAATDGKKLTIGDNTIKTVGDVYVSDDEGDTWSSDPRTAGADYNADFGKNVKAFTNKDGKIAFMILGAGGNANEFTALVERIKYSSETEKLTVYIAKMDGTETTYEVNKDTKLNGTKVTEAELENEVIEAGAAEVVEGQIVKMTLTTDGAKVATFKTYSETNLVEGTGFSVNKTSDTIAITDKTGTFKYVSDTKILKVKEYAASGYIKDVEAVTWAALESIESDDDADIAIVTDNGKAKFIVIYDDKLSVASDYKYGMVFSKGVNEDGDYWVVGTEGKTITKNVDSGSADTRAVIKFKLNSDDEIKDVDTADAFVAGDVYNQFKVTGIDKANSRIKLTAVTDAGVETNVSSLKNVWYDIDAKTMFIDITDDDDEVIFSIDSLNDGDIIQLYDVVDTDGYDWADDKFDRAEQIYDFIVRVDK